MNLEHVKYNFTCEISHVKNHMFQIHMFNFTHVKSCGIFVRVAYLSLNGLAVIDSSTTIGCPKVRVEIFTLARGARACIESTQFIIMTLLL